MRLRPADEELIAAARAVSDRVVVAVMAGSAVVMPWLESVPAALMVWYPGSEGGHAFADVLLGHVEPGGRLPFAIPRAESDLVDFHADADVATYGLLHGQWHLDATGTEAHLPFGFGLGYTDFALDGARLDGDGIFATVTNSGPRAGATVVQVYGGVPDSAYERPQKRLMGFAKVRLDAGAEATVEVPVDRSLLDMRIDGGRLREDLPVEWAIGFDAASTRPI